MTPDLIRRRHAQQHVRLLLVRLVRQRFRAVDARDLAEVAAALGDLDDHRRPLDERSFDFGSLERV